MDVTNVFKKYHNTIQKKVVKPLKSSNTLSNAIGIDLGTVNTVGVLYDNLDTSFYNQSSLVALNTHTNRIEAFGDNARSMLGRTPSHIDIVRPVQEGVVADFEIAEQVLAFILRKAEQEKYKVLGPTVVVSVPPSAVDIDIHTFRRITKQAGAREVYIVNEPLAALVSITDGLEGPKTTVIIDVGGGTTDILVFSQQKVVMQESIPIAGCLIDRAIYDGLKEKNGLEVGSRTAEDVKLAVLSDDVDREKVFYVRGKEISSGLPIQVSLKQEQVDIFSAKVRKDIVNFVREKIETLDPDLGSDLLDGGVYLSGGGSNLANMRSDLELALSLQVFTIPDPFESVARGAAIIANNPSRFKDFFI